MRRLAPMAAKNTSFLPLTLLLFLYLVLTTLYGWATPPFEGPDGPEHVAYVTWLLDETGLPPLGAAAWETAVRQEASQPPLYYATAAAFARLAGPRLPPAVYRPNPHFPSPAPGDVPDNKNVAIHYPSDSTPLQGGWRALAFARLAGPLFGLLLLLSLHALGRRLWPSDPRAALGAVAVAIFTPQLTFLSAVITNDVAAGATAALTLWALVALLQDGPAPQRAALLGLALGAAVLTKSSNAALVFPIFAGGVWLLRTRRTTPGALLPLALLCAAVTLLVAGWWYGRNLILAGSIVGLDTHCYAPWAYCDDPGRRPDALAQWNEVFQSYWAAFGWGNIKFRAPVYTILAAAILAAFAGLLRAARLLDKSRRLIFALFLLMLLVLLISLELWMRQVTAPHGRLLFPALAPITLLLVAGWRAWWRPLPWAAAAALALLSVAALITLVRPAYGRPAALPPDDSRLATPLNLNYGNFARLLAVSAPSGEAGEALPVTLCWEALRAADRDYSILVHLVGPGNAVIAGRRTYPGLGAYPTSTWDQSRRFCDALAIPIPDDLADTLVYQVEVAFIDPATEQRLPVAGGDGRPQASSFVAATRLEAAGLRRADEALFGAGPFHLLDATFAPAWTAGSVQPLTLAWTLDGSVDDDLTTYVHLRPPGEAEPAAQADGPPRGGWYPTRAWTPLEVVVDERFFAVPEELPAGTYDLVVGWYDTRDGRRVGDEFSIGNVMVVP